MSEFRKGQRVRVEFEATVRLILSDGRMSLEGQHGEYLYTGATGVTITPLDPPDWPPQVGDIWETDGREYYVRAFSAGDDGVAVRSFDNKHGFASKRVEEGFKTLNPVLVRRRGQ